MVTLCPHKIDESHCFCLYILSIGQAPACRGMFRFGDADMLMINLLHVHAAFDGISQSARTAAESDRSLSEADLKYCIIQVKEPARIN